MNPVLVERAEILEPLILLRRHSTGGRIYAYTVTLKQTECRKKNKKIAAAAYLYLADNDGEWGELRFDFKNGTAEIVKLADGDTVKSNIFAKAAIRYIQNLPEARILKSVVVPFEMDVLKSQFLR